MPALNFRAEFADAVERGEKCQTIRAYRKDGRNPSGLPFHGLAIYWGQLKPRPDNVFHLSREDNGNG